MPAGIRPNVLLQEGIAMVKEAAVAWLRCEFGPQVLAPPLLVRTRFRIGAEMSLARSHDVGFARQPSVLRNRRDRAARASRARARNAAPVRCEGRSAARQGMRNA